MKNRITIQSLRNLDLNSLNEVLADIYRELNRIADSADEISFRTTRDGNKELLINDGQKEYRDNTRLSRFGLNLSSEKIKAKDLAKNYVGVKYYDYVENSNLHKFFSNEDSENTIVDIVTGLKSSILRFTSGANPRWKIGFDTDDTVTKFKINSGSGITLDDPSEFELDSSGNLVLTGTLTSSNGVCSGTGALNVGSSHISTTGTVSFGTLTDVGESIAIGKFVDEADGIASNDNDNTIPTSAAVKDYTDTQITGLVDSAPGALDTLNELAAALNDDANFSTTITNSLATKLPLAGGTMTGDLIIAADNKIKSDTSGTWNFIEFDDDSGSPENQTLVSSVTNVALIVDGNNNGTGQFEVLKGGTDGTATELFRLENDGDAVFTGDLYIPGEKKIQFDSADTSIYTNSDNPEDLYIESDEDIYIRPDDNLVIAGGTTNYVTFDGTNKRVGIGTTNPGQGLHVVDTGSIVAEFESSDSTTAMVHMENSAGEDGYIGVTNAGLVFSGQDFNSNNMIVDTSGNVGIGTTTPDANLQIHSTSGTKLWLTAGGSNPADAASLRFAEQENGTNYMQLSYNGSANELSVDSNNQDDMTVWNRANNRVTHGASTRFYRAWPQVRFSDDSGTDYVDGGLSGNTFLLKTSDDNVDYQWQNSNSDILMSIDSQQKTVTIGEGNQNTYALKIGNGGRMNMPLKGLEFEHNHGYWNALGEFGLTHYLTATQNDLIRHRTPLTLERWNGSAYVDALSGTTSENNPTNNLQGLKNILDGSRTTSWLLDDEWRKFRFVITRQQAWAEENLIYLDLSWSSTNFNSGSSASGSMCPTLTIEQLHLESGESYDAVDDSNNDWTTNATVTSDWHSTGIANQYGTFFIFNNSTHHSETHVRITLEFPAWDASEGGSKRMSVRNIGMLSQSASARNTEVWTTNWDRDATGYGHVKIPNAHSYYINNVAVLGSTTLGSGVVNSSLTNLGTLTGLTSSGVVNINGTSGSRLNITNTGDTAMLTIESQGSGSSGRSNIKFNTNGGDWELGARNSNGSPDNSFYIYENGSTAYRLVIEEGGHVGIGTTNPNQKLDVAGSIQTSANLFFNGAGTHYLKHNGGTASSDTFTFRFSNNEDVLAIRGDGRVGINDITPSEALDVSGNIAVTGTVDGRDLATDGSKLDGIEAGATADQTGPEIAAALNTDLGGNFYIGNQSDDMAIFSGAVKAVGTIYAYRQAYPQLALSDDNGTDKMYIGVYQEDAYIEFMDDEGAGAVNRLRFRGDDQTGSGDYSNADVMTINFANNRVGINTTSPAAALDVVGTGWASKGIRVKSTTTSGAVLELENSQKGYEIASRDNSFNIRDTAGDTSRFSISSGGNFTFLNGSTSLVRISSDGKLGIGTTSPSVNLHVKDTSGSNTLETIRVENSNGYAELGAQSTYVRLLADGNLTYAANSTASYFYNGGAATMGLTSTGLGIGTTSPDEKLHVAGDVKVYSTSPYPSLLLESSGSSANFMRYKSTDTTWSVGIDYDDNFSFAGSNITDTRLVTIEKSTGKVGIGNTSPNHLLHVGDDATATFVTNPDKAIQLSSTTNDEEIAYILYSAEGTNNIRSKYFIDDDIQWVGWDSTYSSGLYGYKWQIAGNDKMALTAAGKVGIGTTSPEEALDITDTSNNHQLQLTGATNANSGIKFSDGTDADSASIYYYHVDKRLRFYTDNTEQMNILANGNVGIGTTSPTTPLQVAGNILASDASNITVTAQATGTFGTGTRTATFALLNDNAAWNLQIAGGTAASSGFFEIRDNTTQLLKIDRQDYGGDVHVIKDLSVEGDNGIIAGAVVWERFPFIVSSGVAGRYYYRDVDDGVNSFALWDDYDTDPTGFSYLDVPGQYVVPEDCTLKAMSAVVTNFSSATDITLTIYHGTPSLDVTSDTTLAVAGTATTISIDNFRRVYAGSATYDVDLDAGDIIVPTVSHANAGGSQTMRGNITLKFITR